MPLSLCDTLENSQVERLTQTIFNPLHCLLIQPLLQQLVCQVLMGDSVKGLTEIQEDKIHCSLLIHQAVDLIIEIYGVGQA